MSAKVAVIIPTYNQSSFLAEAVQSVLAQTRPADEVIVVDDGSTDSTQAVIETFGSRVRAIHQRNSGVAAARNTGVRHSSSDYVAFLDSDDVWLPGKLELQLNLFQARPYLGLVHCGVEEIDEQGSKLRDRLDGVEGAVADSLLEFDGKSILGGGSGAMMPRNVFDAVQGFDERLSTSADWDLYYRIARRYPVGFAPEVALKYRLHGSNMHGNVRAMEKDMLLAFSKAFEDKENPPQVPRRKSYGNLHTVLAGASFQSGDRAAFLKHTVKTIAFAPEKLGYFLGYRSRLRQRRLEATAAK